MNAIDTLKLRLSCDRCGHEWDKKWSSVSTLKDWAEDQRCPECEAEYEWLRFADDQPLAVA